jgi:hypothetical protein
VWLASAEDGVWVASDGVAFVANSGGPPQVAGDVYNFRPFLVADKRVWFISGPHDPGLPKGGVCGNAMPHNDMWIAATAISRRFPLVSCDQDFDRIAGPFPLEHIYLPTN